MKRVPTYVIMYLRTSPTYLPNLLNKLSWNARVSLNPTNTVCCM